MAFSISPPPPPPPLEAVSDEVEKAAEETVDAVENLLEQVLDVAADELTNGPEKGLKTVQQDLLVLRDARREEQRLLAEIVGASMSFIQDRQQDARRLEADAKTATLIMVAVVLVVIAVIGAIWSGGSANAMIRAVEELMSLGRLGARAAGLDGARGNHRRGPASGEGEMELLLLRVLTHLRRMGTTRDRLHTRLLVLQAILNAVNALIAGSRRARPAAAEPLAPWVRLALGRLARCLAQLEARLRIRGVSEPAQAALHGLTRMRGSLAETAQLVRPPVVRPAGLGSNALPPRPVPRVPR